MKALPAVLLFVLLLPPCLFGQSGKPQTIIVPTGSLGEVSEVRIKILEKTLESKLDDYFDIVPKDRFEEAQEQAFQEMELEECTEEQCIMMIREILQVENSFQLVLMVDGGDTQVSLTWNDLDKKRVEEEYCEGCKTKELRESVGGLVERLIKAGQQQPAEKAKKLEAERRRLEAEKQQLAEAKRKAEAERKRQEELAALKQKQESEGVWTESDTGMKFRRIPGGSFRMGSPSSEEGRSGIAWLFLNSDETPHMVRVGEFWVGETEVTQAQWQEVMGSNPSSFKGDDLPVEMVSWEDIQEFIKKLNARSGKRFRLPTEAEWEYAARAGTQTARYWGDGIGRNNANCDGCGSRWDNKQTAPAGSFKPNAFGLFDMLGNVWEWTCSEYKKHYDGSEQKCSVSARKYSLRGGSWFDSPGRRVRAADRWSAGPGARNRHIGFRLAQD
jgi:formylglycine-generating enzyme required for sulfatase activity